MATDPPTPLADLIRRIRTGDPAAMDEAYARHRGLVGLVVHRFRGLDEADDMEQVAALGLVKALKRYDPGRGLAFSTYAVPLMLGEVRHWLRDHPADGWGRGGSERRRQLQACLEARRAAGQPAPTVAELAAALSWDRAAVVEILDRMHPVQSLGVLAGGHEARSPGEEPEWAARLDLQAALAQLPMADRALLEARFGRGESQAAVGRRLALSQAEISRRQARAVRQLKRLLGRV